MGTHVVFNTAAWEGDVYMSLMLPSDLLNNWDVQLHPVAQLHPHGHGHWHVQRVGLEGQKAFVSVWLDLTQTCAVRLVSP